MTNRIKIFLSSVLLLAVLAFNVVAHPVAPFTSESVASWQDRSKPKELPKESPKKDERRPNDHRDDKPKDDKGKKKPDSDY